MIGDMLKKGIGSKKPVLFLYGGARGMGGWGSG